jgi:pantoate--beta-alanine ligase
VNIVWTPTAEGMYPDGFQTWVDVEALAKPLEGEMRPGHFRGAATVVTKLFNAVQPQWAYFGQKDAQQVAVICRMTADLNFPVEIVVCPTVREADGLAMSSRNKYLGSEDRQAASILFRALSAAKAAHDRGEHNAEQLRRVMRETLAAEPRAQPQYVSCADYENLEELEVVKQKTLLSLAVLVGQVRLIDNVVIE